VVRIVHVVARSQRRGAEVVALELSRALDDRGHDNRVVALGLGLRGERAPELPPILRTASLGVAGRAASVWPLRRLLVRERPDVVVAHGGTAAQVTIAALPRRGPAAVWQLIEAFYDQAHVGVRHQLWRQIARRYDGAVALTEAEADELRTFGFTGALAVVPTFRSPQRFVDVDRAIAAQRLRAEIGVAPATKLIGFVGYLVPQKRPERALDVLAGIRQRGEPAHLVVAGDGPLRESFQADARARGLDAHVSLLGHRDDVERVFGGVDLAVMTSDHEGVPGVAIEAAMTGCPFVTFPLEGVNEVVINGVTGVVLAVPDVTLMADAVFDLLRDDAAREQLGKAARHRSSAFAAPKWAQVYEELLEAARARRAG
jgi:glycosyltransferase involved in cell wall biosynthesis